MIKIIVISHGSLAKSIFETVQKISSFNTDGVYIYSVASDVDTKAVGEEIKNIFDGPGDGVLVLADLFGGSGCNIPLICAKDCSKAQVVSGVNLNMLLSALQHRESMDLTGLASKVEADGKRAIVNATKCIGI